MKQLLLPITIILLFSSCREKDSNQKRTDLDETVEIIETSTYPKALDSIFDAHGGLKLWKGQRTLSYVISKPDNPETHTIDLYSRKDKIETTDYEMGFDGNRPWLWNKEKAYDGNVEFYHNLMFYFYAMPFVLADDGIYYDDAPDLNFEGRTYPGIRISYGEGIGTSPKDEYYVHYDPKTYEMQWLGYTVTYRTGEDSDNVKWIRYDDWGEFEGLLLPRSISWYNYEGRNIKDLRNTVKFESVSVSTGLKSKDFYEKPSQAEYFTKPME